MLNCLIYLPILDLIFVGFFVIATNRAWASYKNQDEKECVEERSLGMNVITSQLSSAITSGSIIIAGVGAVVGFSPNLSDVAKINLFYSALWAIAALFIAQWAFGTLSYHAPNRNVVRQKAVAMLCSSAVYFAVTAGLRFISGLGAVLGVHILFFPPA